MRKQKKYHYIYKTINELSGKYYIGMHSTDNLDDGYLGSGTRLRRSINKYGKDNFKREILEFCDSRELLKAREEEVVNLDEIAKIDCMNLKVGGYGGFIDGDHHKKMRVGASKYQKKKWVDEEYRIKISKILLDNVKKAHVDGKIKYDNFIDKKHSEESKEKMSESKKGRGKGKTNSQFGKCWITNEVESKKISGTDLIPEGWRLGRKM
jgi:hypothetical protein|tara:strand:- start:68168 stop:68794 length:627 start_codon:yes stop_codon:yes gene_type:complete